MSAEGRGALIGALLLALLGALILAVANAPVSTERAVQGSGLCEHAAYEGC